MTYTVIRRLLEQRTNTLVAGTMKIAFENVPFVPVQRVPYIELTLLAGRTQNPTMGDQFKRETGILQLAMMYPVNEGPANAMAKAEEVRALFPRGLTLTQGTVRVLIDEHPFIGPAMQDEGWYRLPVSIPYIADVG